MANVTWTVSVKVCYVKTKKVDKKGKPITTMVFIRNLYLNTGPSFMNSGEYRIFAKTSKTSQPRFTVSVIPRIAQSCWTNPSGKCETWYTTPPDVVWVNEDGSETVERPYKRTDDPPMNEQQCLAWLTTRMGEAMAKVALETLLTQEPEQREVA